MDLVSFFENNNFYELKEEDKALNIIFYYQYFESCDGTINMNKIISGFVALGLNRPNKSRLVRRLKNNDAIHHDIYTLTYRFTRYHLTNHAKKINIEVASSPIVNDYLILPRDLFPPNRQYLVRISEQINASFEQGIYDGCAVLMRRLLETLLIHSYENLNISQDIKDDTNNYSQLSNIIGNAKTNTILGLSRGSKEHIDKFRDLGNWSAHRIYYNTRYDDLNRNIIDYRAIIEELLNKSNI